MPKKHRKVKKTTLLMAGEGVVDKAFIDHLKEIYARVNEQLAVTSDSADGGSPGDMVRYLIRKTRHVQYERLVLVLDADIAISQNITKMARQAKIEMVLSEPICLEGMLLQVLAQPVPDSALRCKKKLHPQLSGQPSNKHSYSPLFDKPVLEQTRVRTVKRLIGFMVGEG